MVTAVQLDIEAIARVSEHFGVRRLRVFGSVLTDRFDVECSDVDFLVDFHPNREDRLDDYLGLKDALVEIVGRDVDLVVADAVRNPYFKKSVFGSAQDVYAGVGGRREVHRTADRRSRPPAGRGRSAVAGRCHRATPNSCR